MASTNGAAALSGGAGGTRMMQYDYLVKLLIIGDSGVGKSSLLVKFVDGKFAPNISQTVGMDFKVKMLELGGKRVKLQIWDTAGQERFHTITQQYYRNAMGIILVYDATNEESFNNIRRWAAQIAAHGNEDTNRMLLGNKADYEDRTVDNGRGKLLAEEYGMPFMETSAKSGVNVEEAFISIADAVRRRLQARDSTHDSSITNTTATITLQSPNGQQSIGNRDQREGLTGGGRQSRCCLK